MDTLPGACPHACNIKQWEHNVCFTNKVPGYVASGLANDMELAHLMPVCRNILLSTALWQSPLQQGIDRLVS